MKGRRVPRVADIEKPGDYSGPHALIGADPSVFFLLPIAHDEGVPQEARSLHRVASPPHSFRECADGSLEIRESIGALGDGHGYLWHGYLDEGHEWRTV